VLVGRHGPAEGEIAECLQGVVEFIEPAVALQSLGDFAFRRPVPAYKHSMAQALHLRGLVAGDEPHPESPRRPDSDREIIRTILERIDRAARAAP